ncbi:MAG: S8 family serine peptidase [Verrucomicrobia bacterium]|nr:S8 family serine peptidase [Verrucomicrobiota bacterium]
MPQKEGDDFSLQRGLRGFLLASCAFLLFIATSWCASAQGQGGAPFRGDRILIKPAAGKEAALQNFHARGNIRVVRQFPAFDNIQVLQLPPGAGVRHMILNYKRSGLVDFAEPDFQLFPASTPNDPRYADGSLWHLHNTGQSGGVADADIDAPEAWQTLNSASNIVIAIVDTGIRYTHEDLAANMWTNPGEIPGNGIDDDGNGYVDDVYGINAANNTGNPIDTLGHGTQVAGVAGAVGNNGVGIVGVSWRVKLMACRFFSDSGDGFLSDAIQSIDYARAKGAHIINASFVNTSYSSSFYTAINNCRTAGIIFVAAAGNDTINNDATPYYPASYNLDNIVAVAATTRIDSLASYSNYGATSVDLGAPGSSLYTTYHTGDSAYVINSGTSFASPLVAGAFALMKARYPQETYKQLIDRVLASTDPLPSLSGKCVTGGRLNLATAMGPSLASDFVANPIAGTVPLTVNFTNASFGNITNFAWTFGDGNTSSAVNPTHTYTSEGNFSVTLTVTGTNGLTSSKTRTVSAVSNYTISSATYNWIDPTGMTALSLSNDGVSPAQSLPFSFSFYGQSYDQIYISANGLIGFENQGLSTAVNADIPNASLPNNIIAPFWDDLNPAAAGTVYVGTTGTAPNRKAVISWVGVRHVSNPPTTFTFQAVLEEGFHRILFQYQDVKPASNHQSAAGKSATIGVEHSSGLVAAKYSFNGSTLLSNGQAIQFTATSSGGMNVTPSTNLVSSGIAGGPFTPASQVYTIENTAASTLNWSVSKSQNWVSLSASNGTLASGQTANVTVSINGSANALLVGSYFDTIAFLNLDNGIGDTTRSVSLAVNGTTSVLSVTPADGLSASGYEGGLFMPVSQLYTLQNSGNASLNWSATHSQNWVSLSATNGTLGAGSSTTVTVSINSEAAALQPGNYLDTVDFANLTSGDGNTNRTVSLAVHPVPPPMLVSSIISNQFTLELIGEPLQTYVIDSTADFLSWSSVATNTTSTNGTFLFSEPIAGADKKFYRGTTD